MTPIKAKAAWELLAHNFLGAYLASLYLKNTLPSQKDLLEAYLQSAWQGEGLPPSGYDVLAQSQSGCVFIERQKGLCKNRGWHFKILLFLLLHTGKKLATHEHLKSTEIKKQLKPLADTVYEAQISFETVDSKRLIDTINTYYHQLLQLNLVAEHSMEHINFLRKNLISWL